MKVLIISVMCVVSALGAPSVLDNKVDSDAFSRISKMLGSCVEAEDITTCLAVKGIAALNRAARSNKIDVLPGVTLSRDQTVSSPSDKSPTEMEILSKLSNNPDEKSGQLLDLAMESATNFVATHKLEIKVPEEATQEMSRAIDEGRGKMKKLMGPLMMAFGAKLIALIPILLGGLALLATKALIVAKIAFVLALVLGASKLIGGGSSVLGKIAGGGSGGQGWGGNSGWSNTGGWSGSAGSGGYPYARSIDSHDLAYNSQIPSKKSEQNNRAV